MKETNVRRAIIDALNTTVPKSYRRAQGGTSGIGHTNYKATNQPRKILAQLRTIYGHLSPGKKETNDNRFKTPWNHANKTIKDYFNCLKECYVAALWTKLAYTIEQLMDKVITSVQLTGLYPMALLEWNGFKEDNKTWPELKLHFTEAYDLLITIGGGTAQFAGYHGANVTVDDDEDSLTTITNTITNMHLSNNANAQAIHDNMASQYNNRNTRTTRSHRPIGTHGPWARRRPTYITGPQQCYVVLTTTTPTTTPPSQIAYNMQQPIPAPPPIMGTPQQMLPYGRSG